MKRGGVMALIKCPECGKEVNDTVENCIHCGFKLKIDEKEESKNVEIQSSEHNKKDKNEKKPKGCGTGCLTILIFIFLIGAMSTCFADTTNDSDKPVVTEEKQETKVNDTIKRNKCKSVLTGRKELPC